MQLLPLTHDDALPAAALYRRAFEPGGIYRGLFGLCPPDAFDHHLADRIRTYLTHPNKVLLKVVLSEAGAGQDKLVGWAWWDVPCREQVVMPPRTFPAGTNEVVATEFFVRLVASSPTDTNYELEMLATEPGYTRRGIGKSLVAWGIQKAAEEGLPCYLDATAEGVALYKSLGFESRGPPLVAVDDSFEIFPMVKTPPVVP